MLQTVCIRISGRVQGVFYRQSTKEKAKELGITGIVRNLKNGDVEILATGAQERLDELADWCKQGPPQAEVESISTTKLPLQTFSGFNIEKQT
jgi:acylphosphatase